jgi:hypothetical protein
MTNLERVLYRVALKFNRGPYDQCWEWTGNTSSNGYGRINGVSLYDQYKKYTYGHITTWALQNGRWPVDGEVVRHTCDNPPCVNPRHLVIGTQQQNVDDRPRSGRWFGLDFGKLTPEQVEWARSNGLSQFKTAQALGVSQSSISNLRMGKTYKGNLR